MYDLENKNAKYRQLAFKRYQLPYGADQEKRMTRWANKIPMAYHTPRWPNHDICQSQVLDMYHADSGAEGLF